MVEGHDLGGDVWFEGLVVEGEVSILKRKRGEAYEVGNAMDSLSWGLESYIVWVWKLGQLVYDWRHADVSQEQR